MTSPGMPDPDWNRYPGSFTPARAPVGDPIKWGGIGRINFGQDSQLLYSEQIIQVAAKDAYSRPWSIVGEVNAPASAWEGAGGYPDLPVDSNKFNVWLEIVLGVGQIQISQQILLMSAGEPTLGLCNQQSAVNGGPYGQTYHRVTEFPFGGYIQRPFAAIGALIGNTISVRAVLQQGVPSEYNPVFVSAIVGPLAAGTQL